MPFPDQKVSEGGEVLFQRNFDKDAQHELEITSTQLIQAITGYCTETGLINITEPQAVSYIFAKLSSILHTTDMLCIKYHEVHKKAEKDKDGNIFPREHTELYKIVIGFKDELVGKYTLNGTNVVKRLEELMQYEIAQIAVKHKLMDKVGEFEPWELDVKKKFFLNELTEEEWLPHENYLEGIRHEWKKEVFLETAYMVLKKGDIVKLISGINNSGKTWTSIPEARFANWLLRNYWAKPEENSFKLPQYVLDDKVLEDLKKVKKFSMKEDVIYYPDPVSITQKVAEGSRFNTFCITEGLKAAINLRSYDPEVIDMILELFTERASNNYISFEYQLTRRPPKLLISRFNTWLQKMGQRWVILSMPSSLYRTEDPLYTKEIEKIKGDRKISSWFTHKSGNANFIAKFKAPKLKPKLDALFKKYRKEAKLIYEKGKGIKKSMGNVWYSKIEEYYKLVKSGQIAYFALPEKLKKENDFTDEEVRKFLKDYNRFQSSYKLLHPNNKDEIELEVD